MITTEDASRYIENALYYGWRIELRELAEYVRAEERSINPEIRNHIADLLANYPKKSSKRGAPYRPLTLTQAGRLFNIAGDYHHLRDDLRAACKAIRQAKRTNKPLPLAEWALKLEVPIADIEAMLKPKQDNGPANTARRILARGFGINENWLARLITKIHKQHRPGSRYRKALTPLSKRFAENTRDNPRD